MKKTFAFIAVAAAMLATGTAKAQLGINIGYAPVTLTTETTLGNTTSTSSSELNGFFAGVNYNYGIAKSLGDFHRDEGAEIPSRRGPFV